VSTPSGIERPISTQVNEFLASNPVADRNALYGMWGGANDVFYNLGLFSAGAISQAALQTNVLAAASAEIAQIARLRAAGARFIMVFALPDIGATPQFAAAGAATAGAVSQLSAGYNTTLFTGLASAGIRVIPVDAFSLFTEVRTNPGSFGLTNVTGIACGPFPPYTTAANITSLLCNPSNTVPDGATTYAFADGVHPTTAAHKIIAQFTESLIDGPSNYGLIAESALQSRSSLVRAIGDGVTTARKNEVGKWDVFFGGHTGTYDIDAGQGLTGLDSRARAGTIGATARVSEAVTVGAAFGSTRNTATFRNNGGGYTVSENVWSLFASTQWGGLYGTALVSAADLRVNDVHRYITLGTGVRKAEGKTEGSNAAAQIAAGYDFRFGRFVIAPNVSVTMQDVDINGFDESGAGSANLRMMSQTRKSEMWSGGLRVAYDMGRWVPWIKFTADKERRDGERLVSATPLTMVSIGQSYDVPTYVPDSSFTTFSLGINGLITDRIALSLAGYQVSGRTGIHDNGVNGMVSVKF
jgi:outer membrane lipase/esterase